MNGSAPGAAGRRVVLDRDESLDENIQRIAHKLKIGKCPKPRIFTRKGIEVQEIEEVIEGEVLLFEPRGEEFHKIESAASKEGFVGTESSFGSTVSSVTGSCVSRESRHRRRRKDRARRHQQYEGESSLASVSTTLDRQNSFEYDYLFKFILVGSVAVGKSCLLLRFTDQQFRPTHETTIGVDFGTETIRIRHKDRIKIQIWDTAGQEYFKAITRAYFREAAAALIVYDVMNRGSFNDLKQWLDNVKGTSTNNSLTIMLIGNKADASNRQVSTEEGEAFARENGLLFMETSALSGYNVREAFTRTADAVLRKINSGQIDLDDPSQGVRRGDFNAGQAAGKTNANAPSNGQYRLNVNRNNNMGNEGGEGCYC
eukprot:CAMPEP_0203749792 /NCGR_PEP_ID=MMETSP0098-20131031/4204_1 /ASSEMBLY_ACC=CAM_ASM_000208 /TAXON_ID=96639 /ORGANISM=" , Strain NY0313808BC1" /LENGTH=370 /DNA_ID=CAMNT_0050638893 /DNA_START=1720 /DNA_END=2832 /DNA_ORIENTATION=+